MRPGVRFGVRPYLKGAAIRAQDHVQARITGLIAWVLPWVIRRSLRRGLHGVYARGAWDALPRGGVLLAANHHTWWDLYLAWLVGQRLGRPLSGLILAETLARFPFFRAIGAVPTTQLREVLRRLGRGELLVIFPEGELRPAARVEVIAPGLEFLAGRSGAPVYPVAVRGVLRGAQRPEIFMVLGQATPPAGVKAALNDLLAGLEAELAAADPETPLPGFTLWSGGASSTHERTAWLGKLLGRRTG